MNLFKSGTTYPLKDPKSYDDEFGERYGHAQAYGECDGMTITDCWIVNADGDIHPGMDECPVPVQISDLDTTKAFETERHQKLAAWA